MPRKKTEENHVITEPDISEAPDFTESEDSPYEPDMAPLAKEETPEPDNTEKTGVFVKLTGGGSFSTGDYLFRKNEPVPVPEKLAEKLLKTGFFERG